MARPKKVPRTAKQKKMTKIVAEVDKRDRDPNDKRSDTAIIRQAGYAATTKPSEVFSSIAFLEAHELFYKDNKTTDEVAQQSAAKARRNILRGLDNEDDKIQLDWTKLQLKLEETTESKTKLKVVVNGSMLELMGNAAKEHLALNGSPMNGTFELGEVPDVKGELDNDELNEE